jgi:diguanylate cyclase (GGDEF)-like protein/PAS domain S-box-containing protein
MTKLASFIIVVLAILFPISAFTTTPHLTGILGVFIVGASAVKWGIKGGAFASLCTSIVLVIEFVLDSTHSLINLSTGILVYYMVGLLLGMVIDIIKKQKRELYREISERKKAEEELKKKCIEQELLLENIDTQIFYLIDAETYGKVNKAHAEFFGLSKEDIEYKSIYSVFKNKDEAAICIEGNKRVFEQKVKIKEEEHVTNFKGEKRIMYVNKTPKLDEKGNVEYVICTVEDITERKKTEEYIRFQAYHDSLTGVYNRSYFDEQIERIRNNMSAYLPCSIISIDLDGLKIVNDTFGHKAGDELLVEAAKLISMAVDSSNILSRTGGDEFCILLPRVNNEDALKKVSRMVELLDDYNKKNPKIPLSMSIGLATCENPSESIFEVYQKADDNMYRYKLAQSGSPKSKVIELLMAALSERDYIAYGHGTRLTKLSEILAEKMGLNEEEKRNLFLLCRLHDLGKLGIPDEILFKEGKLTDEEYEKMKEHTKIGFDIANRSKELAHIAHLILHHHERWDGKGYPHGLKGYEIPLECRILSVIDAYDSMTNDRAYHKGISKEKALNELIRCRGKQFDPEIVDRFVELMNREAMQQ